MLCPKCGTQSDVGAAFCSNCGTALLASSTVLRSELDDFATAVDASSADLSSSHILKLSPGERIILDELPSAYWTWPLYVMTLGFWIIWRNRHRFILTNQRLIVTAGIVSKSERSVQLSRIQEVNVLRSLTSGGKVSLTSAGGPLSFRHVGPLSRERARVFAETMTELLSDHGDGLSLPSRTLEPPHSSVADEIQKLVRLRDSGAISEEEFVAHKAKLLQ